jgi:hypothetical protein
MYLTKNDPDEVWLNEIETWNSNFKKEFLSRMTRHGWIGRFEESTGNHYIQCPPHDWKICRRRHTPFLYPTAEPRWNPAYDLYYKGHVVGHIAATVYNWDTSYSWNVDEDGISTLQCIEQYAPFPDIIRHLISQFCV